MIVENGGVGKQERELEFLLFNQKISIDCYSLPWNKQWIRKDKKHFLPKTLILATSYFHGAE